ncbi:MAG TPA: ribulose-phosphate 3-epimerase [Candidatus Omnitrophota bacterium]|nr:ribulose-phosphate 3-epimerase [Candidatus Omnitrophota bacterium]
MRSIQVSASILCADFMNLADDIRMCEESGVDMLHVDVMDGHFVPNITVGPLLVEAVKSITSLPVDAHLMIENPGMYIDAFLKAGADSLSLHAECYAPLGSLLREIDGHTFKTDTINVKEALKDIQRIKDKGKKAFMVLNPGTPICIQPVLEKLDGVLIMSVNPGFAKQKFMPVALSKIHQLRSIFAGDIAVDGGINHLTAPEAVKAGANILATASYFFGSEKPKETIRYLKSLGGSS